MAIPDDNAADWNGVSNDAIYDTGAGGGVWSRDECYKVEESLDLRVVAVGENIAAMRFFVA